MSMSDYGSALARVGIINDAYNILNDAINIAWVYIYIISYYIGTITTKHVLPLKLRDGHIALLYEKLL